MGYKPTDTLEQCQRWSLDIRVTCEGCGRSVVFGTGQLLRYCRERKLTTYLRWLGRYFVCKGRAGIEGCGHRGARLTPLLGEPPPPGPPVATGEYVPRGVDPEKWRRADERGRKRMVREARG